MALVVPTVVLLSSLQLAASNDIRLVSGVSSCDGYLQMNHSGKWRDVIFSDFFMDTAAKMCQHLDCGSVVTCQKKQGSFHSAVMIQTPCIHQPAPMDQCVNSNNAHVNYYYLLNCSGFVRLHQEASQCSGSVEVNKNQTWTLVSEEDFDLKDAEVVCRELGCGAPSQVKPKHGVGHVSLEETIDCEGNESALMDCPRSARNHSSPGKAVVLTCAEPIRLVGGSGDCDGTVELRHRGEWRPLYATQDALWGVADAVCLHLDCGAAVLAERTPRFPPRYIWEVVTKCVNKKYVLKDCICGVNHVESTGVRVLCSGKHKPNSPTYPFWLIPAGVALIMIIIFGVVFLIFWKKRKSIKAQRRTRSLPETHHVYENVNEDHTYESLSLGTRDQDQYNELKRKPC